MSKMKPRKGMTILEGMPNRMKIGSGKKKCLKHDEIYDNYCLACKREYGREHYRRKKDPFA